MLISIVTPVYNCEKHIKETMDSIHSQSYRNFEHIVMDGGSTDATLAIVKNYPNVHVVSERDHGQTDALNKGFKLAKGDILAWQNADDTYLPDAFQTVIHFFSVNPDVDIIYGSYQLIDSQSQWVCNVKAKDWNDWLFSHGSYVPMQPTVFWRRRVYEKIGDLDIRLKYCMDIEFFAKASRHFKFKAIKEIIGQFRIHDESKTNARELTQVVYEEKKKVLSMNYSYNYWDHILFALFSFRSYLGKKLKPLISRK